MNEKKKRKRKKRTRRTFAGLFSSEKSDSTFLLRQKLARSAFTAYFTRVSFPLIVSFITVEETRFVHQSRDESVARSCNGNENIFRYKRGEGEGMVGILILKIA